MLLQYWCGFFVSACLGFAFFTIIGLAVIHWILRQTPCQALATTRWLFAPAVGACVFSAINLPCSYFGITRVFELGCVLAVLAALRFRKEVRSFGSVAPVFAASAIVGFLPVLVIVPVIRDHGLYFG